MNNDLISRSELKKAIGDLYGLSYEEMVEHFTWVKTIDNVPTVEPFERIGAICNENCGYKPKGEFTNLERKVIADSINYLLGAELLEENGYTEEVVNALKSVLQKIDAEENHL